MGGNWASQGAGFVVHPGPSQAEKVGEGIRLGLTVGPCLCWGLRATTGGPSVKPCPV